MTAVVTAIGRAFPPTLDQRDLWEGYFADHYDHSRAAARLWRNSGVERRHAAVDPRVEDLSAASTGARMRRYLEEALPLGKDAVAESLAAAGLVAADVDLFTVVSCTGYATPGIDILLARDLAMAPDVQRLNVGHMGCYAALPALASVADAAVARGKTSVLLCVELTSLHVQPPAVDLEQVVAHALFSDAAATVTVEPDGTGLAILDVVASTDAATADHMTWDVTDLGFRMGLSPRVPAALERHLVPLTERLLAPHGLRTSDVAHWAIHPGGPRIIQTVARELDLTAAAVAPSTEVLRTHGNCSSATILLVLDEILRTRRPAAGDHVVAMAFGPGLTLYAALLRAQ